MADYGLVLSSDGSKSSFEIGAWKALRELDINISAVSGSFVGALNAALIAQGDFERAVRFWRNISSKNLFGVNKYIAQKYTDEWSKSDTKVFKKSFLRYIQGQTEELAPLKEILQVFIDEKTIRKSSTKLGFVSVSLSTLEAEMLTIENIPKGKLTDYLLAAACFPQIAQVNRAKDAQFSTLYSPYAILQKYGAKTILSTDDIIVIPPNLDADITIIQSSEALVLDLSETAEMMKKNIKLGYIDTLKLFEKSLSSVFFVQESAPSEMLAAFRRKIGREFSNHLDYLIKMLLRINNISRDAIEIRIKQMLAAAGIKNDDIYIAMIENAAKILQINKDEKYTFDKLITAMCNEMNKRIHENKQKLSTVSNIREIMMDAAEPGKSLPAADIFTQYFILLISSKPSSYDKLFPFVGVLNIKTIIAIITMIYLLY